MNINMLEITSKYGYKCDLEPIIDSNSQYFWINLKGILKLKQKVNGLISLISMVISQL